LEWISRLIGSEEAAEKLSERINSGEIKVKDVEMCYFNGVEHKESSKCGVVFIEVF